MIFVLTPRDLLQMEFDTALRGYNKGQVDDFIRRLVGEYERLARRYAQLEEEKSAADASAVVTTAEQTAAEAMLAGMKEQAAASEARLATLSQESVDFQARMRILLQELAALLEQGEAETDRLLQLMAEALDEEDEPAPAGHDS